MAFVSTLLPKAASFCLAPLGRKEGRFSNLLLRQKDFFASSLPPEAPGMRGFVALAPVS